MMRAAPHLLAVVALLTTTARATPTLGSFISELPQDQTIERRACSGPVAGSPKTWWRAAIEHNGTTPYSVDATYQYYRSVVEYGADATGRNDSSDALN